MKIGRRREGQEEDGFDFVGGRPQLDLLDYRYMDIEMTKPASTDTGCMSLVAVLAIGFFCVGAMLLLASIRGF